MHKVQFSLPNDLEAEIGLPCHRISIEVRSRMCLAVMVVVSCSSFACLPKYFAKESEDNSLFAELFAL